MREMTSTFISRTILAGVALSCMVVSSAAAQPPNPARLGAQKAAVSKLAFLAGKWQGDGWIEFGGRRATFTGGEHVQSKHDGLTLLVEGAFFTRIPGTDRDIPVHTTLAVIAFDPETSKYRFSTWLATGAAGVHDLKAMNDGFQWEIRTPQGVMRYTMTLTKDDEWFEIGEQSADGTSNWQRFFEMRLRKTEK
jgi:hypothetical protein